MMRAPRHHYVLDPGYYLDGAAVVRCRFCFGDADHAHTKTDYFDQRRRLMATRPTKTTRTVNKARTTKPNGRARPETRRQMATAARSERTAPAKRPRQVPLTGMEDVRIKALDECCGELSDIREKMSELRGEEADQLNIALKAMRKHDRTTWQANGIELIRVPGEEKLRCRNSREKATGETDEDETEQAADNNGNAAEA